MSKVHWEGGVCDTGSDKDDQSSLGDTGDPGAGQGVGGRASGDFWLNLPTGSWQSHRCPGSSGRRSPASLSPSLSFPGPSSEPCLLASDVVFSREL